VTGPGTLPKPRPSSAATGVISPIVPVTNISSASASSAAGTSRSSAGVPRSRQSSSTTDRVIPSGQARVVEVITRPARIRNRCVALVSASMPAVSSSTASSTPAALASSLARMLVSWLQLWMCWSSTSAKGRRCRAVIRRMPWVLSKTGGLCSARLKNEQPAWLIRGSRPLVYFRPRDTVSHTCSAWSSRSSQGPSISARMCWAMCF
jgi:hypothetical protein